MEQPLAGARVLRLGHHDPAYARSRILAKALARAGAEVVDVSHRGPFLRRTPALARDVLGAGAADLVMVAFPGHADVPLARLLARRLRAPLVFDAFVSVYEAAVEDRRAVAPGTLRAARYRWEDAVACRLADVVLMDTDAHADYLAGRAGVARSRVWRVWPGADDEVMRPAPLPPAGARPRVLFVGTFIPLHGADVVVRAAHLLEEGGDDVEVVLVGSGQTLPAARSAAESLGVRSVAFLPPRPYGELPELIAGADVCLGIFGTTGKASRVVPNKAFDALAVGRPLVTADTPAAREALTHGTHAWLVPPGDPEALAAAIRLLVGDPALRGRLAAAGHRRFQDEFSIDALARSLAPRLAALVRRPAAGYRRGGPRWGEDAR